MAALESCDLDPIVSPKLFINLVGCDVGVGAARFGEDTDCAPSGFIIDLLVHLKAATKNAVAHGIAFGDVIAHALIIIKELAEEGDAFFRYGGQVAPNAILSEDKRGDVY